MSTFDDRMKAAREWSTARRKVTIDANVADIPELVRRAVARVDQLGVKELSSDGAVLFRKTTFAYRAGSVELAFHPEGSATIITAVTRTAMWVAGADYGRGNQDLDDLFDAINAETPGGA